MSPFYPWYDGPMEIVFTNMADTLQEDRGYQEDFEQIMERALRITKRSEDSACSVIWVTPEKIHEINRDYRQVDRPTDVISFALQDGTDEFSTEEEAGELGDIFISIQAAEDQAREYGHSLRRETCFLFCHGLLHLLGYDHMTPEEEAEMFALQDEVLDEVVHR